MIIDNDDINANNEHLFKIINNDHNNDNRKL